MRVRNVQVLDPRFYRKTAGAIAERGSLVPRGFSVRSTGRFRYTGALPIPDPQGMAG